MLNFKPLTGTAYIRDHNSIFTIQNLYKGACITIEQILAMYFLRKKIKTISWYILC